MQKMKNTLKGSHNIQKCDVAVRDMTQRVRIHKNSLMSKSSLRPFVYVSRRAHILGT